MCGQVQLSETWRKAAALKRCLLSSLYAALRRKKKKKPVGCSLVSPFKPLQLKPESGSNAGYRYKQNVQRLHIFLAAVGDVCTRVQESPPLDPEHWLLCIITPALLFLRYSGIPADRFHPSSNVCEGHIPHPRLLLSLLYQRVSKEAIP